MCDWSIEWSDRSWLLRFRSVGQTKGLKRLEAYRRTDRKFRFRRHEDTVAGIYPIDLSRKSIFNRFSIFLVRFSAVKKKMNSIDDAENGALTSVDGKLWALSVSGWAKTHFSVLPPINLMTSFEARDSFASGDCKSLAVAVSSLSPLILRWSKLWQRYRRGGAWFTRKPLRTALVTHFLFFCFTGINTYIHIYIYLHICICMYVWKCFCVCVHKYITAWLWSPSYVRDSPAWYRPKRASLWTRRCANEPAPTKRPGMHNVWTLRERWLGVASNSPLNPFNPFAWKKHTRTRQNQFRWTRVPPFLLLFVFWFFWFFSFFSFSLFSLFFAYFLLCASNRAVGRRKQDVPHSPRAPAAARSLAEIGINVSSFFRFYKIYKMCIYV